MFKKAYRLNITFFEVLYPNKISPHKNSVLLIRVDTQPQNFKYTADKTIISKFDIFSQIFSVPIDILLAQKISCLFTRPRLLGRDFYDIVFLLGKTKPNIDYLKATLNIKDKADLKEKLLKRCHGLDYKQLDKDVGAFLFSPNEKKKVLLFYDYLKEVAF